MKPGWKNRIDERRYFEEKRLQQQRGTAERIMRRIEHEAQQEFIRIRYVLKT